MNQRKPGDYPLGSPEGRAAARAVLEDPGGRLAYLIVEFVGVMRDSRGELVGPYLDFRRAAIGERVFERGEGEGLEAFKARHRRTASNSGNRFADGKFSVRRCVRKP